MHGETMKRNTKSKCVALCLHALYKPPVHVEFHEGYLLSESEFCENRRS
jgi:hypothetical protein